MLHLVTLRADRPPNSWHSMRRHQVKLNRISRVMGTQLEVETIVLQMLTSQSQLLNSLTISHRALQLHLTLAMNIHNLTPEMDQFIKGRTNLRTFWHKNLMEITTGRILTWVMWFPEHQQQISRAVTTILKWVQSEIRWLSKPRTRLWETPITTKDRLTENTQTTRLIETGTQELKNPRTLECQRKVSTRVEDNLTEFQGPLWSRDTPRTTTKTTNRVKDLFTRTVDHSRTLNMAEATTNTVNLNSKLTGLLIIPPGTSTGEIIKEKRSCKSNSSTCHF